MENRFHNYFCLWLSCDSFPPLFMWENIICYTRKRSSLIVKAFDSQSNSCNSPGFDPSIRPQSGIGGAAYEAVYLEKTKKTFYFSYVETAGKMDVGRGTFVWSLSSLAAVFVCGHGVQRVTRWSGNLQSSSTRYSKIGSQFIPSLVSTLSGSWSFLDSWSRFQDKQGDGSRIRIHNIQKY